MSTHDPAPTQDDWSEAIVRHGYERSELELAHAEEMAVLAEKLGYTDSAELHRTKIDFIRSLLEPRPEQITGQYRAVLVQTPAPSRFNHSSVYVYDITDPAKPVKVAVYEIGNIGQYGRGIRDAASFRLGQEGWTVPSREDWDYSPLPGALDSGLKFGPPHAPVTPMTRRALFAARRLRLEDDR